MRDSIAKARCSGPSLQADGAYCFQFVFGADDPTFAGHFPGKPILPGVFQIEMTRMAAEWANQSRFTVSEISKAKFQRPISPDEPITLELKSSGSEDALTARAIFSVQGQQAGELLLRLRRCE